MIDVRVIVKEWACHAIFFKKKMKIQYDAFCL